MSSSVHRSQRRVSCEGCRKTKARCQRIRPTDSKCVRCTLLKIECIAGQQKKIGRPLRSIQGQSSRPDVYLGSGTVQTMSPPKDDDISNYSQPHELLTPQSEHDWSTALSPEPSLVDSPAVTDERGDKLEQVLPNLDNLLSWDSSWECSQISSTPNSSFDMFTSPHVLPLHTPMTVSSPAGSFRIQPEIPQVDFSDSLADLQRISFDLHTRAASVKLHKDTLNLDMLIYQQSPLFMNNLTMAESLLKASQDFLSVLHQLRGSQSKSSQPSALPLETSCTPSDLSGLLQAPRVSFGPLVTPLALNIISIFVQLIDLYELNNQHLLARLEQIDTLPVAPMPGLNFGSVVMVNPCTQGMLYVDIVVHLLEGIEGTLGIGDGAETVGGLLSPRQKEILWSELGGESFQSPGHGVVRLRLLKKTFQSARMLLKQMSLRNMK